MYGGFDTNLNRFLDAQRFSYEAALAELRQGRKEGHWIWFIFPQMKGLGHSSMAQYYGISGRPEATAYLNDPVLGARLRECCEAVLAHAGTRGIVSIMVSELDAMKLRSSMTLFDAVSPDDIFARVLEAFFHGDRDSKTLKLLAMKL